MKKISTFSEFLELNIKFLDPVTNDFKCVLCKHILKDAFYASCGCLYCQSCLKIYLEYPDVYCPGNTDDCAALPLTIGDNVKECDIINKRIERFYIHCPYEDCKVVDQIIKVFHHYKAVHNRSISYPLVKLHEQKEIDSRHSYYEKARNTIDFNAFVKENMIQTSSALQEEMNKIKVTVEEMRNEQDNSRCNKEILKEIEKLKEEVNGLRFELDSLKSAPKTKTKHKRSTGQSEREVNNKQSLDQGISKSVLQHIDEDKLKLNKKQSLDQGISKSVLQHIDEDKLKNLIESQFTNKEDTRVDGEIEWKITNLTQCFKLSSDKELWSEPSYSHKGGYKFAMSINSNNYRIWLSVSLLPSENDHSLQWPFTGNITCVSLCPTDSSKEIRRKMIAFEKLGLEDKEKFNRPIVNQPQKIIFWYLGLNDINRIYKCMLSNSC